MKSPYNESYLKLSDFFKIVWRSKYIIMICCVLGGGISLLSSKLMTTMYQAEVIIGSPIKNISSGFSFSGVPDVSSILSGNTLSSSEKQIQSLMSGSSFAIDFMISSGISQVVNSDSYDGGTWVAEGSEDWAAIRSFRNIFSTRYDYDYGHLVISSRWTNPAEAADWANKVAIHANSRLQELKLRSLSNTIVLVENRLQSNTLSVEVKVALNDRLLQLLIDKLVTESEPNFGITIFDEAVAPVKRVWPNLKLLLALGLISGLFVGLIIAVYREVRIG
ncbi:MAG: hypothetical protein CML20_08865 [Rheinheimera sp.]|uniref:Wzz/FepE/Etk N-terminal domain-containing protein n=1 Tax=Arsukibacterium sp. UBA3155 TaxID=1946058 RepID=UPI000C9248C7|nr:Wzz/FepE/Etk N-terminal domain-containing protein [Arsukibacterium sp. UBA3155]MAD74882.1 hypothetical protein [Rheinheimera sp.]|tara:strand:- start:121782 stop:122612 length:831 start_codon:yes stop_codon:yes gene_type:complete